jgi:hypothetical protein
MPSRSRRLIVNWRSPATRAIIPVAELTIAIFPDEEPRFEFGYVEGVRRALEEGFEPFLAFPELGRRYLSGELFPFFQNRVMPTTRPDYLEHLAALGLDGDGAGPDVADVLGRSAGLRQTDQVETVLVPERDPLTGRYLTHFLVRAVRHVPGAEERAAELNPGDELTPRLEPDNAVNRRARQLFTPHGPIGYVPDYLLADLDALEAAGARPKFVVERVNASPHPAHYRVLARCEAVWPDRFRSFDAPFFEPLDLARAVA